MSDKNQNFKDFIYFDLDKATSILSQLKGGLIKGYNFGEENTKDERNIRQYNLLSLFKPEFGGIEQDKKHKLQYGVKHHEMFNEIEKSLRDKSILLDINKEVDLATIENSFRESLNDKYYVIAEGLSVLEDFSKIKYIAERFNKIAEFINKCTLTDIEESVEYQKFMKDMAEKRKLISGIKNNGVRKKKAEELKRKEEEFIEELKQSGLVDNIPDWLLDGIIYFIDTFIANRINLRIYPFEDYPEYHVISNLKRECFIDSDLENILFAYGSNPNVKISVLGLITSLPENNEREFDPLDEYKFYEDELTEELVFEKAFREMFRALEGFEKFVRFSHFPNVTLYPIAVYRNIKTQK